MMPVQNTEELAYSSTKDNILVATWDCICMCMYMDLCISLCWSVRDRVQISPGDNLGGIHLSVLEYVSYLFVV